MNKRLSEQGPTRRAPAALVADETEERTRMLAGMLEEAGYVVLRERSGQRTIERARAARPDVIIIADVPDVAATELCRMLRGDAQLEHHPPIFVALAQPATPAQRLAALRARASECIGLPLDSEEVVLRAEACAQARRDAEQARADGLLDPNTGLYNRQGLARRARELGSLAFREHGPFACVVLAFDIGTDAASGSPDAVSLGARALQSAARRSDVIGRLGPTEFAVLAPGTSASGARHLAERLARTLEAAAHSRSAGGPGGLRVRCGIETVANVGYTPIEPVDLLVRAAAGLRTS